MDSNVDLARFLETRRVALIRDAMVGVRRSHLTHYEAAGDVVTDRQLETLMDVVIRGCSQRHLEEAIAYAAAVAYERHATGYPLVEVQTAVNVLEETIWRAVVAELTTAEQAHALGLVSTVLGAVKDALARGYVEQAESHCHAAHVEPLFSGCEGGPTHRAG